MIKVAISEDLLMQDESKAFFEESIFKERINYVVSHYADLLTGEKRLYSILLEPSNYPKLENHSDIVVSIIPTLIKYEDLYKLGEKSVINLLRRQDITIHKDTTHVFILDLFGRIWRILTTKSTKAPTSFLGSFYGCTKQRS